MDEKLTHNSELESSKYVLSLSLWDICLCLKNNSLTVDIFSELFQREVLALTILGFTTSKWGHYNRKLDILAFPTFTRSQQKLIPILSFSKT